MILNVELCPPPSSIDIVLYFLCNILIFASYLPFYPLIDPVPQEFFNPLPPRFCPKAGGGGSKKI